MNKLTLIVLAVLFSGCAITPIYLTQVPGESRISATDPIGVSLSKESADRVEGVHIGGTVSRDQVHTGEVWRRVFCGYKAEQPTLEIISSEIRESVAALGFSMRYTYTAKAVLYLDGQEIPISATGSRAAAMNMLPAIREAVELAAVDAAHQARAIISANQSAAPAESPKTP